MKKQLIRAAATSVLGLSLMTGFAAADINTTGPGSSNRVTTTSRHSQTTTNNNRLNVNNRNNQSAYTGNAKVYYNTKGGDASSGSAMNDNSFSADVSVDNSGSASLGSSSVATANPGSIDTTGPGSSNSIHSSTSNTTRVTNNNNLSVSNNSSQRASSGDATVQFNTKGGSATTGDASNTNSSDFTLSVTN